MLDVGFQELILLAFIGLLVLGPERLPRVVKTLAMWVRKARRMAGDFQRELEKEVDLQEFRELRKDMAEVAKPFDEVAQKAREIESGLRDAEHSLLERERIGVAPEARHEPTDPLPANSDTAAGARPASGAASGSATKPVTSTPSADST